MFRRLDSVSVFRQNLLSWVQPIEVVPISGHLHQHKRGYKTGRRIMSGNIICVCSVIARTTDNLNTAECEIISPLLISKTLEAVTKREHLKV
jgi:hypothetical protein